MTDALDCASVHGRFQPLHLEHMEYLLAAFKVTTFVHIGITQFDLSHLHPVAGAGSHRDSRASNPLTYFERAEVLTRALSGAGLHAERYRIGPFPIEHPEQLPAYLPATIPILTTRVDEWNDTKINILTRAGYRVEVLYARDRKGVSGDEVRRLMSQRDDAWTRLVPSPTIAYLRTLDLGSRMQDEPS